MVTEVATGCRDGGGADVKPAALDPVLGVEPLGFLWKTLDPFLFCAHHDDHYPKGNAHLGPAASLAGRDIGMDFTIKDGFRMYHGDVVPGFPEHPHRGFETVTIVRKGLVDHSDSLGAAARYGGGDVQWLTAGNGIVHAEMFPLLSTDGDNPLELFQIWVNLPSTNKLVDPHFAMLWGSKIPRTVVVDSAGRSTEVTIIAGRFASIEAPAPPPKSWAANASNDVHIWTLKLAPGARIDLPAGAAGANRMAYFFEGDALKVNGRSVPAKSAIALRGDTVTSLENGSTPGEILILHGRPIGEPVAQRGPFVMNTSAELAKAFTDYRATGFGGWPWKRNDPVHDRDAKFARHADGHVEKG